MALEAGLIGYAGWTSLMLAMKKHRSSLSLPPMGAPGILAWLGCIFLLVGLASAIAHFGAAYGVVIWVMQSSLAAALLVLIRSYSVRLAIGLAGLALIIVLFSFAREGLSNEFFRCCPRPADVSR